MPIHISRLLLDTLDEHWRRYRISLIDCRHDCSENAVHELRFAIRRLLAMLALLTTLNPKARAGKLQRLLKTQLDCLNALRDTQVMLLEIGNTATTLAELKPFLQDLQAQESRLLAETRAFIKTIPSGKIKRKCKKLHSRCKARRADKTALLEAVDKVYGTALQRYLAVDPHQLPSLHHLRISMKKLRYLLLDIQPWLPDQDKDQLPAIKDYLTLLGDIQNSAVLTAALTSFYHDGLPTAIAAYYQAQQQALLDRFMLEKVQIYDFWRVNP
ncbi:CHAD domain-containing protein [Methylomonas paludis]|uniref:CHAD domain-containing protein n=1 Tax=Methylomonas paludis TaxID=1173101 RepID=A0A975MNY4_9GAMM|nr:CHAD domain-containing protein [Methylomonas paludis]QWF71260.1 CHAD domain-containing protein [Methylomonas paludis]